jgi:hypothetical protein
MINVVASSEHIISFCVLSCFQGRRVHITLITLVDVRTKSLSSLILHYKNSPVLKGPDQLSHQSLQQNTRIDVVACLTHR